MRIQPRLINFIVNELKIPDNRCIEWINNPQKPLTFRITDSNELARRWGEIKNNISMNYEKLSRSLR